MKKTLSGVILPLLVLSFFVFSSCDNPMNQNNGNGDNGSGLVAEPEFSPPDGAVYYLAERQPTPLLG